MGWSGGNDVFDSMAKQMQTAPYALQVHTMTTLIKSLEEQDWDDADSALEDWKHVPAYVEAFRACGYGPEEEERLVPVDIFIHADAECGYEEHTTKEDRASLGWPPGDERYELERIAYEVTLNLEVNSVTGDTKIVGLDGRKLMDPTD